MPESQGQERTEPATEKKRREEREKGNVAKSVELNAAVVLLMGILVTRFSGGLMLEKMNAILRNTYHNLSSIVLTPDLLAGQVNALFVYLAKGLFPLLLFLAVAALGSNFLQVGFLFARKALVPNFSKLNVITGFKNLFSPRAIVESIKGILKICLVGFIGYLVIHKHIADFLLMAHVDLASTMRMMGDILFELTLKIGIAFLVLAVADFFYQRYRYEESIKMTKQEKQDESKQYEGNPEIKSKIRAQQRMAARRRMLAAVPDATVVVTNPTHLAVALQYDMNEAQSAPVVVAKGKRKIAERIKAVAREHGVPVVENKPLARALYAVTEVGMEIPAEFYQVVAELLVQIYREQQGGTGMRKFAHAV